ncbi:hypothetical protein [Calothrix sp. NIES-2098]|uniref:hypothetical protein n=1 Tax=Calothrix sp. NIES-2098 TaxID=1954171 RepID=UPI0030D7C6AC
MSKAVCQLLRESAALRVNCAAELRRFHLHAQPFSYQFPELRLLLNRAPLMWGVRVIRALFSSG